MSIPTEIIDPNSGNKLDKILYESMKSYTKGYSLVGKGKYCMRSLYHKYSEKIQNFEVRDDDIWVVSFLKTGTTWTQEMVWCIENNLDYKAAEEILQTRFPYFDHSILFDYDEFSKKYNMIVQDFLIDSVSYTDQKQSPRFIKSHLPWELLPNQIINGIKKPKIIYVARNAKDTCVSLYHHSRIFEGFEGTFEEFFQLFIANKFIYLPYSSHVLDFWNRRNENNILFLRYEDMKQDLKSVIKRVSTFLNRSLSDDDIESLSKHLSFDSMKNNKAVNFDGVLNTIYALGMTKNTGDFMRSGTIGSYKAEMTPEMIATLDKNIRDSLKGTGLVL